MNHYSVGVTLLASFNCDGSHVTLNGDQQQHTCWIWTLWGISLYVCRSAGISALLSALGCTFDVSNTTNISDVVPISVNLICCRMAVVTRKDKNQHNPQRWIANTTTRNMYTAVFGTQLLRDGSVEVDRCPFDDINTHTCDHATHNSWFVLRHAGQKTQQNNTTHTHRRALHTKAVDTAVAGS